MGCADTVLLSPVMPADGGNGLAMRAGLLLEGLARAARVRVLVVPVFGPPGRASALVGRLGIGVEVLPLDPAPDPVADIVARLGSPRGRERAGALHPLPALCRLATTSAAEAVAGAAAGTDLVLAQRLYLAPFLDALLDRSDRARVALDVDDVESVTQRALGMEQEATAFERLEAHYLPLVDRVITCAGRDRDLLADRHDVRAIDVVPNAVRLPPSAASAAPAHDLLFVGNLSYRPNADAARWLCTEVLPRLGGATLAVVGSRPGADVRALGTRKGVTVAADVPDVTPWYAGASVAVVPVGVGGGTRIKIVEALAHRRPVVSTTAGADGLGLAGPDGPVAVADSAEEFAGECRRLLDDPTLAERLARRGEEIVRETATVDVVAPRIAQIARAMVAP